MVLSQVRPNSTSKFVLYVFLHDLLIPEESPDDGLFWVETCCGRNNKNVCVTITPSSLLYIKLIGQIE
jgi:hypothetical protein